MADKDGPKPGQPLPPPPEYLPNGKLREPTLVDGIKSVHVEDLKNVHKVPCARDALLVGIAAGFVFGGVKLVFKAPVKTAANWAVGTFMVSSLGAFETCQYRREKEKAGMMKVIEVIDKKQQEKEKKIQEFRAMRKAEEEAKRKAEEEANRRWWKPW